MANCCCSIIINRFCIPTAFLVDVCNNIYISGHGGLNTIPTLYTTSNALYTSGSFYLMQLSQSANVDYATHFTGNHVMEVQVVLILQVECIKRFVHALFFLDLDMTTTSNAYSTSQSGDCDIGFLRLILKQLLH